MAGPDVSQAVQAMLEASGDLVALVGSRIHSDRLPQGSDLPAVVYWIESEVAHQNLQGDQGLAQATVRILVYADSRSQANQTAFHAWYDLQASQGIYSGVHVFGVHRRGGTRQLTDRVRAGTDEYRYVTLVDLLVSYNSIQEFVA